MLVIVIFYGRYLGGCSDLNARLETGNYYHFPNWYMLPQRNFRYDGTIPTPQTTPMRRVRTSWSSFTCSTTFLGRMGRWIDRGVLPAVARARLVLLLLAVLLTLAEGGAPRSSIAAPQHGGRRRSRSPGYSSIRSPSDTLYVGGYLRTTPMPRHDCRVSCSDLSARSWTAAPPGSRCVSHCRALGTARGSHPSSLHLSRSFIYPASTAMSMRP